MRTLVSTVCAATLLASSAVIPATAFPSVPPPQPQVMSDSVVEVGSKKRFHNKRRYHGHRRYHHRRYNNNNNWWIPGAIIGGMIIGGALSQPRYSQPAGNCGYWSQRCSANWSRPSDYRGCMRYYGCY